MTSSDRVRVDRDSGQLVVYSAEETDAGQWECVASNELGEDSIVAQLTLIGQYHCQQHNKKPSCRCLTADYLVISDCC